MRKEVVVVLPWDVHWRENRTRKRERCATLICNLLEMWIGEKVREEIETWYAIHMLFKEEDILIWPLNFVEGPTNVYFFFLVLQWKEILWNPLVGPLIWSKSFKMRCYLKEEILIRPLNVIEGHTNVFLVLKWKEMLSNPLVGPLLWS